MLVPLLLPEVHSNRNGTTSQVAFLMGEEDQVVWPKVSPMQKDCCCTVPTDDMGGYKLFWGRSNADISSDEQEAAHRNYVDGGMQSLPEQEHKDIEAFIKAPFLKYLNERNIGQVPEGAVPYETPYFWFPPCYRHEDLDVFSLGDDSPWKTTEHEHYLEKSRPINDSMSVYLRYEVGLIEPVAISGCEDGRSERTPEEEFYTKSGLEGITASNLKGRIEKCFKILEAGMDPGARNPKFIGSSKVEAQQNLYSCVTNVTFNMQALPHEDYQKKGSGPVSLQKGKGLGSVLRALKQLTAEVEGDDGSKLKAYFSVKTAMAWFQKHNGKMKNFHDLFGTVPDPEETEEKAAKPARKIKDKKARKQVLHYLSSSSFSSSSSSRDRRMNWNCACAAS